jgi:hypothetical protein
LGYNSLAGQVGLPAKPMPGQMTNLYGPGGQMLQRDEVTGKETEVTPQKLPTYSMEDLGWDPNTGREKRQLVQTSPGGAPAPGAPAGGAGGRGGGLGTTVGPQFDTFKAPNAENNKAAMFGGEMRSGMQTLTQMEAGGFNLSPKARALAINMATSEDDGAMKQLLSQEVARHGLTQDEQTYISAMMPMLQAAGHDQSGARLTTAQIRQNVESLIPMDTSNPANMKQVASNRQGFYQGLLTQAGPALQQPQYRNTLLADQQKAQSSAGQAPPSALAYLKAHPETAAAFKAKYGYAP